MQVDLWQQPTAISWFRRCGNLFAQLAEIQCLAVEPKYQVKVMGSELVRRCVELADQRGVMEVLAISSSDSFLQKLGFNYSLPDQKRALFCQLRSRDQVYGFRLEESSPLAAGR